MSEPSYVVFDHRSDGANDIEAIGHDIAEPKAACFSSMLTLAETSRSGENAGLPCGALPKTTALPRAPIANETHPTPRLRPRKLLHLPPSRDRLMRLKNLPNRPDWWRSSKLKVRI